MLTLLIATSAVYLADNSVNFPAWVPGLIAVVLFTILEISIRKERIELTDKEIEFREGIIAKKITRVPYHSISNVLLNQTVFQRLMRYGDLFIDTPGGEGYKISLRSFDGAAKMETTIKSHIHKRHELHHPQGK